MLFDPTDILQQAFQYKTAMIIFVIVLILFYTVKAFAIRHMVVVSKKTKNEIDDVVVEMIRELNWPTASIVAYVVAMNLSDFGTFVMPIWIRVLIIVIVTYQVVQMSHVVFDFAKKRLGAKNGATIIDGFQTILSFGIWIMGGLVVLTTLGYNVTSLIAGLGIGGVAIALALQNILGDLFSALSIYFDRPFGVGDYITTGKHSGTVQRVGLKNTRLRSIDGQEIIVANKDITNSTVENFGGMKKRRVTVNLGIAYETTNTKLKKAQIEVPKMINAIPSVECIRFYLKDFGNSALEHQLVYVVHSEKYDEYVEAKNIVNLALKEYFEKKKIEIAYPTQVIYTRK